MDEIVTVGIPRAVAEAVQDKLNRKYFFEVKQEIDKKKAMKYLSF